MPAVAVDERNATDPNVVVDALVVEDGDVLELRGQARPDRRQHRGAAAPDSVGLVGLLPPELGQPCAKAVEVGVRVHAQHLDRAVGSLREHLPLQVRR